MPSAFTEATRNQKHPRRTRQRLLKLALGSVGAVLPGTASALKSPDRIAHNGARPMRKLRILCGLTLLVTALASSALASAASSSPSHNFVHSQATARHGRGQTIIEGCAITGNAPSPLYRNEQALHAEAWITRCTNPPPAECRVGVAIWQSGAGFLGGHSALGRTIAKENPGEWTPCKQGERIPVKYPCRGPRPYEFDYETEIFGQVKSTSGALGAPEAAYISPEQTYPCIQ